MISRLFLQKLHWIADPVGYMERERYPDIFSARLIGFGDTLVFVHNPPIQQVLTKESSLAPLVN